MSERGEKQQQLVTTRGVIGCLELEKLSRLKPDLKEQQQLTIQAHDMPGTETKDAKPDGRNKRRLFKNTK